MESPKSTKLLSDIFAKLSLLTKEDEEAQGIVAEEQEVVEPVELQEEVTEPTVEEPVAEEATEEKVELEEEELEPQEDQLEEESEDSEGEFVKVSQYKEDMAKVVSMMEELKKRVDEEMGAYKKEKEMMAEEIEKLSAEPAAEPISHNPTIDTKEKKVFNYCLLYTSPSPRDRTRSRMPSSA